jgi:hypothetical protein
MHNNQERFYPHGMTLMVVALVIVAGVIMNAIVALAWPAERVRRSAAHRQPRP